MANKDNDYNFIQVRKQLAYSTFEYIALNAGKKGLRALIDCHILNKQRNSELAKQNIFEVAYSDNYFEYIGFEFEGGVIEVFFVEYFSKRVPKLYFLQKYAGLLRFPKMFEIDHKKEIGAALDAINAFWSGEEKNFLILNVLPFTLEIKIGEQRILVADHKTTIPFHQYYVVESFKGSLTIEKFNHSECIKRDEYEIREKPHETSKVLVDIDSNYIGRVILPWGEEITI